MGALLALRGSMTKCGCDSGTLKVSERGNTTRAEERVGPALMRVASVISGCGEQKIDRHDS